MVIQPMINFELSGDVYLTIFRGKKNKKEEKHVVVN